MKNDNAVLKNDNALEQAAAMIHEVLDVLQRVNHAPESPLSTFMTPPMRRELRREAKRLRKGQTESRYKNLHSSEGLADVYERTAQRDEILEQSVKDLKRISQDFGYLFEENNAEILTAIETVVLETVRSAKEQGPGSEAAQRCRHLLSLAWVGLRNEPHLRRGRVPPPLGTSLAHDPSVEARAQLCAAEPLAFPPPGETVIAIPPDGTDSGRVRMFLRIGLGDASWIGSFERGDKPFSSVFLMPDTIHLFVSAEGAGYIIDATSRTLVEQTGTEVAGLFGNDRMKLFFINHNDTTFEAFGANGRLWKTDAISSGGFQEMSIKDHHLVGEARQPSQAEGGTGWVGFGVDLVTGEVRFADAEVISNASG